MSANAQVRCGADRLLREDQFRRLVAGRRVGVVVNQTAVTADYTFWPRALRETTGARLEVVFSPEHGLFAEQQDQVACEGNPRGPLDAPVVSLYGVDRELSEARSRLALRAGPGSV